MPRIQQKASAELPSASGSLPESEEATETHATSKQGELQTLSPNLNEPAAKALELPAVRTIWATLSYSPHIVPVQAVIGMGRVNDQDLQDDSNPLENAHLVTNLVNYEAWLEIPIHRASTGDWTLGPLEVPQALAYRVVAWGERGYYLEDIVPSNSGAEATVDAGTILPTPYTGLILSLHQPKPEQYAVLLGRNPDSQWSEEDSQLSQVLGIIAPESKRYYAGKPIVLSQKPILLAPMYPDPSIFLTLETQAGTRSAAVEIPLQRDQITPVTLDPEEAFEHGSFDMIHLSGKLVFSDGTPVQEASMKMKGRNKREIQVKKNGAFRMEGLSPRVASSFRVDLPMDHAERPKAAQRHFFTFNPEEVTESEASVNWVIPTYRWLVLGISELDRTRLAKDPPYPVYLLQKKEQDFWGDIPADLFLEQKDGLAISLTQTGDYRGVIALSPYFYYYSNDVVITAKDQEVFIPTGDLFQIKAPSYSLKVRDEKGPISGTAVAVLGIHTALPPFQGKTDADGRVQLGAVNSPTLYITFGEEEYEFQLDELQGFEIAIQR